MDTNEIKVPPGLPNWITAELIADTLRVWQPYYKETLTIDDAAEIVMNVGRLYDVLYDLSPVNRAPKKDKRKQRVQKRS
jgi:hypothetical protein